ncbi:uncharacterized protein LOC142224457 [Haematobia irritans]|uniref:uncharacterized protein LOC142224457 n=1 Tax=Haematobia irritans TaxID=7368 RepID=UPI003F503112
MGFQYFVRNIKAIDDLEKGMNISKVSTALLEIYKEKPYNTLLLMMNRNGDEDEYKEEILKLQLHIPKIILDLNKSLDFKRIFNAEIIVVYIMPQNWAPDLFNYLTQTLNYMRSTRILVISSLNKGNQWTAAKRELLKLCENSKITNLLLMFVKPSKGSITGCFNLKPYPSYHWKLCINGMPFYPLNWKNMQNKSIIVYAEQTVPRIFLFHDSQGHLQVSGPFGRLIQLFANHYNASLRMYQKPVLDKSTFYTDVTGLVEENLIDIPITTRMTPADKWHLNSLTVEVTRVNLMVPCPGPYSMHELYGVLLKWDFMTCIFMASLIFSIINSIIDWIFDDFVDIGNFLLNDKALPSVLGQSFVARKSPTWSLKLLYLLMFLTGFNINIHFSARIQTLFTAPLYHGHLENFDKLNRSPLKILATETIYSDPPYPIRNLIITANNTFYQEVRQNFNTSYGFYITEGAWDTFKRQQQGLTHKIFCIYDNLTILSPIAFAIHLQKDSEYREPLDYLTGRVHDMGLIDAWRSMTFLDMLKMKEISLLRSNDNKDGKARVIDLFWVWQIVDVGLVFSAIVFLLENLIGRRSKRCSNERK